MKVEMLRVEWNENESTSYYIDMDKHSVAHRVNEDVVKLNSYSGVYTFCKGSNNVVLYDGVKTKVVEVKSWKTSFGQHYPISALEM